VIDAAIIERQILNNCPDQQNGILPCNHCTYIAGCRVSEALDLLHDITDKANAAIATHEALSALSEVCAEVAP
jgi:hypothetical protein